MYFSASISHVFRIYNFVHAFPTFLVLWRVCYITLCKKSEMDLESKKTLCFVLFIPLVGISNQNTFKSMQYFNKHNSSFEIFKKIKINLWVLLKISEMSCWRFRRQKTSHNFISPLFSGGGPNHISEGSYRAIISSVQKAPRFRWVCQINKN